MRSVCVRDVSVGIVAVRIVAVRIVRMARPAVIAVGSAAKHTSSDDAGKGTREEDGRRVRSGRRVAGERFAGCGSWVR